MLGVVAIGGAAVTGTAALAGGPDGHRGHSGETPLTGPTAAKVKEAALAEVKGGSIVRVETDSDSDSPYEAHVRKSDDGQVTVLVDRAFKVTAVEGGPGN